MGHRGESSWGERPGVVVATAHFYALHTHPLAAQAHGPKEVLALIQSEALLGKEGIGID